MKRFFLIPVSLILAGCNATLEPGEAPPKPEFRIEFDSPYRSGLHTMLGGSGQVGARVYDRRDRAVLADEGPTFHSTNSATLTVDAAGNYTSVGWATGPAQIVAEARVGSVSLTKAIAVSVSCTTEIRISLNPTSFSLSVGERFTPSMSLSSCGGQLPVSTTITWSASDPSVLSVNAATGETTAVKAGSAYVQGAAENPRGVVGSIPITVR